MKPVSFGGLTVPWVAGGRPAGAAERPALHRPPGAVLCCGGSRYVILGFLGGDHTELGPHSRWKSLGSLGIMGLWHCIFKYC